MIVGALNTKLYAEWLAHIEVDEAEDAFSYMVGLAAGLASYECHPQLEGVVREQSHLALVAQGARTANRRCSPALGVAGASSSAVSRWNLSRSKLKNAWSRTTARARSQAASSTKSERLLPSKVAAWSIRSRCSGLARRMMAASRMRQSKCASDRHAVGKHM